MKVTYHPLDLLASVYCLCGLIGVIVHGYYIHTPGPRVIFPHFLGLWLALFQFYFGLQMIYVRGRKDCDSKTSKWSLVYYYTASIITGLLIIGYFIGYRIDGGLWCLLLLSCLLTTLSILISTKKQSAIVEAVLTNDKSIIVSKPTALLTQVGRKCNTLFGGVVLVLLFLLLGGAWLQGVGYQLFRPRGQIVTINYDNGQQQKVHTYCTGASGLCQIYGHCNML